MEYLKKLGFNLLVVVLELFAVVFLVSIFTGWLSSIVSLVLFLVFSGVVVALFKIRYHWKLQRHPSLVMTTVVFLIVLILASFAGLEPLHTWKDKAFNWTSTSLESVSRPNPLMQELTIVGKWQKLQDGKVSILSPTLQFLPNGIVIVDDGNIVVTGEYQRLTDEYVTMTVTSDILGIPVTETETVKYQIVGSRLILRTSNRTVTEYQWVE